jgi:glycosyltransferase involved in cell wall biosynthesis
MIEPWDGYSVVTVVDMIYELFPELFCSPADQKFMQLKKACVESSDAVITISRTSANDIIRYYDVDPSCVYPIHLSASQAFKCLEKDTGGNRASTPFFLYVGGRYHYKNFNFFIRAFSRWSQRKEVDLYIVGAPLTDEERKIISSFQIEDQIYCFSDISDDELCELYNRATALVYPSLYEGFGIPLLEAMACGCTVIASSIPSTHEVAGDFPIYFDPEEEVSLRDAFTAALTKEITANDINDAIEWAKKYSWEKTVNQTFNVYKALLV